MKILSATSGPTWIWYPGDYEIWLGNDMNNRRTERGTFFPPFWKIDSHYVLVDFHKKFDLDKPETVEIRVEGKYLVKIDGKYITGAPTSFTIPAGKHVVNVKVHNQAAPPAIYISGENVYTDNTWLVTFEDKEWIDESGKVSDTSATQWLEAGSWNFNSPKARPSQFKLALAPQDAVKTEKRKNGILVDFGKETFGYVKFHGLQGKGKLNLFYGESQEEALDTEAGETLDYLTIDQPKGDLTLDGSRAFRYVYIEQDPSVSYDSVSMLYEYLPLEYRGKFRCNDEQINKIWDVAAYTMHLTSREFFIDGIKRDRWVWSGDASQSYLMNYYLFFDSASVERTMLLLRGKDPVTSHINTIMDYTLYWFISVYDYYQYTGDVKFIKQFYPRMVSLMDYCLGRRNANGMMEGMTGDWVFIDWADGAMDKHGEVSFEQILFCRSLETMALCADLYGSKADATEYRKLADDLKAKLFKAFWSNEKQALVHNRIDGKQSEAVTRYANMFAIFFDYLSGAQKEAVKKNVLLNDKIQKITTPYMRFYELEALCATGDQNIVLKEMKEYWGGMLDLGATSFWEKYDPTQSGTDHYAMYARPYGKSLCHAWGASPIYLLGKYYLGIQPTGPGYSTYSVKPVLGGLEWMDGSVPTPDGDICLYCTKEQIRIKSDTGVGTLTFRSKCQPVCDGAVFTAKGNDTYELTIEKDKEYDIKVSLLD